MLALAVTFTGLTLVPALGELLKRRLDLSGELPRKLVHITGALAAAALPFVLSFREIAVLGLVFALGMALSARLRLLTAIHEITRRSYGEILFPLGVAALALCSPSRAGFVFALLVLGLADGLAGLVGGRYGRRRVPLGTGRKSVVGSATFFAVTLAAVTGTLLVAGRASPTALAAGLGIALALTIAELLLGYGFDNLLLPLLAGLALSVA